MTNAKGQSCSEMGFVSVEPGTASISGTTDKCVELAAFYLGRSITDCLEKASRILLPSNPRSP